MTAGSTISLSTPVTDPNGIATIAYEWRWLTPGAPPRVERRTEASYALEAADFNPAEQLQLAAAITDTFGQQTTLRTAPLQINYPTTGDLTIVIQGAVLRPGVRATVMTAALEDRNGGGLIAYNWEFAGQVGIGTVLTVNGYTFTTGRFGPV